jgi:hypothetical protein
MPSTTTSQGKFKAEHRALLVAFAHEVSHMTDLEGGLCVSRKGGS